MFSIENSVVKTLDNSQVKVLAMKLQLPNLPLNYVHRNALMETFHSHKDVSIHMLCAATGYGKSLTLAQWFHIKRSEKSAISWLTLDNKENDPERFITYLVSAFNSGGEARTPLALKMLSQGEDLSQIVETMIMELNHCPTPLHFAIDDLHNIDNPMCFEYLCQLIQYAPHKITFYLSSQTPLPFSLTKYLGHGRCKEYNESDLALNQDELEIWLRQKENNPLNQFHVTDIFKVSLGWFAGLTILENIVSNSLNLDIKGNERVLVDYLQQQWREKLNESEFNVCLDLALLNKANGAYLDFVFRQEESQSKLYALFNRHLHILVDRKENDWFSLHPMVERYLINLLNEEQRSDQLYRASQWLDKHNFVVQSIDMAFRSGHEQQIADLLEKNSKELLERYDLTKLLSWKNQLDTNVILQSPKLVILFGWALAFSQQFEEAERLLAKMNQAFIVNNADSISGQLFSIRGYIARCRGKMSNAIQLCNQALDKLHHQDQVTKTITYLSLSNIYMSQGNLNLARQYNRSSYESARSLRSIHLEMRAIHEHARIEQVRGHLHLSEKLLDQGLQLAHLLPEEELAGPYARLLIYKGYIFWLKNRIESSQQLLKAGIEVAERSGDAYIIMGYVLLSNIERHNTNLEQAYDLLAKAEATLQYWSVPAFIFQPWLTAMRVNLLIDEQKIDTAISNLHYLYGLLDQNDYALSPEHYPGLRSLCDVFLVRAKSISGQHAKALKLLDKKLENTGDLQQGFSLIFALLMRALLRYQLSQEDNALQDFRKAIVLAEQNYCIMPFIEYSQSMLALYDQLPSSIQESPFVQEILQNIQAADQPQHNVAFAKVRMIISQRELSVLKLIAEGLTNQQIAERLFISLHTVKTHARRINAKLGVKSRTQAIIKARELGVI